MCRGASFFKLRDVAGAEIANAEIMILLIIIYTMPSGPPIGPPIGSPNCSSVVNDAT